MKEAEVLPQRVGDDDGDSDSSTCSATGKSRQKNRLPWETAAELSCEREYFYKSFNAMSNNSNTHTCANSKSKKYVS